MNLKNIANKLIAAGYKNACIAFVWTEDEDAQIDVLDGIHLQVGEDYMSVGKWHADGEGTTNWPMRTSRQFAKILEDLQAAIKH